MIKDSLGQLAVCSYCDSQEIYEDKLQHLWCEECGQHVGWADEGIFFLMLRIPRWPGDWMGSDGAMWSGWMKAWTHKIEPPYWAQPL